ncbi:MAG: aldehyde dehydrogenase family protein, partial [Candidatus Nanopelagicales bacterium]
MSDVLGLHIGGVTRAGRGEALPLVNPATGEEFATVRQSSTDDVALATTAAAAAFPDWSGRTAGDRARILLRLADLIESDGPELTRLEVEETGKPTAVFADGELPFSADNLRFFAGSARSLDGTGAGVLSQGYTSMLVRRPIGVVGSIAPWNFPFIMAIWKMGPALAA